MNPDSPVSDSTVTTSGSIFRTEIKLSGQCDSCAARALVLLGNAANHELQLCAHHFNRYELKLVMGEIDKPNSRFTILIDERTQ